MIHNVLGIKIDCDAHSSETFRTYFITYCNYINFSPVSENPSHSRETINKHKAIISIKLNVVALVIKSNIVNANVFYY